MNESHFEHTLSPQATQWIAELTANETYDLELIKNACLFAIHHEKDNTPFSLSTLTQGFMMADVLRSLDCDTYAIAAAIAYPCVYYQQTLTEKLHEHLDKTVCKIIQGALQMEVIHPVQTDRSDKSDKTEKDRTTGQQNQIDNLRKMMLAMVDDIRTVLLKLAERLIMLQHLGDCAPEMQHQIAQATIDYYAPLANRLGIGQLKWQLEDGAFRYLNHDEYQRIAKALNMRKNDREKIIHQMIDELKILLEKNGIKNTKISGRAKHLYSIHRKIERKQVGFENIYDASAVRILVPTLTDCYMALSLVHAKWTPITEEFDDYIAKPKPNGYQSIHTAILRDGHIPIEIQIRTIEMHESAELGVAAHWKYKENKSVHATEEQKIILLRELLDWQKNTLTDEKTHTQLYAQAFHDRVYVFSPNGDVFDLQKGATPLDFAYLVHTNVGHRCRGAKVNNALVPLTYQLQTGDRIEILTTKELHPSHDWIRAELGYLKTSHAIQKVKQWFKKLNYEKNIEDGAALWEKIYRQHEFKKTDIDKVVTVFNLKNTDALLAALGAGNITATAILHKLASIDKKIETDEAVIIAALDNKKQHTAPTDFSVQGAKHLLTQLAKCCHPIPGDDIIGYITKGRGISVHQKKCRNMQEALLLRPEKLIEISWENQLAKNYRVNLEIQSEDRPGLLRDISGLIAQLNLSIFAITSHVNTQNYIASISLTIEVKNLELLEDILKKIRQISGVISVVRK